MLSLRTTATRILNRLYTSSGQANIRYAYELSHLINKAYSNPYRAYHNKQHILRMLYHEYSPNLTLMEKLVILFHDIYYVPGCTNNEQKSAEIARIYLDSHMLPSELDTMTKMILQTGDYFTTTVDNALSPLVLDLDLVHLAGSKKAFANYCRRISLEFNMYGVTLYPDKFARQMLSKRQIFLTPCMMKYEDAARSNLESLL